MAVTVQQRDDGILTAVAGQSRFGKTTWVIDQVRESGAQRIIVRDPRMEYLMALNGENIRTVRELAARVRDIGTGPGVLCYTGPDSGFDAWARIAYLWGQLWPCVAIGEEISDVTSAGKAPDGWGELIRKGLFYGIHIYSITQRPAECDKTVWGNATVIHSHGFSLPIDVAYMERVLGVPADRIKSLEPHQWIERWAGDKNVIFGGPGA
jgi:hypothetical protein